MEYNFRKIEKNGRRNGKKQVLIKYPMILPNPNIMCWICFLIRVVQVCMWAIRWDISPVIFMPGIKD